jgi:hypothetical protein
MQFKKWLENKVFTGLKHDDVEWWAKYASAKIFPTPEEARNWLFQRREFADQQTSAKVFGVDGPEFNHAFANAMPLYQSGKSWKIGKRIRTDNRFRLNQLEVKRPSLEELNEIAQANGTGDYKFHKTKWIKVSFDKSDYYLVNQKERIANLANQIKNNKWIEAIVYDYSDQSIIEGQHRARAMTVLGFNTVPGVGIEYFE